MRSLPIRFKILFGVVVVNLLGATIVMVYLHESYSESIYVAAERTATLGLATFEAVTEGDPLDLTDPEAVELVLDRMKGVTGHDYGMLVEKTDLDEGEYTERLIEMGRPNNWNERDTNVLVGVTGQDTADRIDFSVDPSGVPASGRMVGVENGACSETCHGNLIAVEGDWWYSSWSTDFISRAHAVFPVDDAAGNPAAVVYAVEDVSWQADHGKDAMMRTLWVILGTLLVSTLAIGGMIDAFVFKRLRRMTDSMQEISVRIAGGDFDAHYEASGSQDEIGKFENFFSNFMDLMRQTLKSLVK